MNNRCWIWTGWLWTSLIFGINLLASAKNIMILTHDIFRPLRCLSTLYSFHWEYYFAFLLYKSSTALFVSLILWNIISKKKNVYLVGIVSRLSRLNEYRSRKVVYWQECTHTGSRLTHNESVTVTRINWLNKYHFDM